MPEEYTDLVDELKATGIPFEEYGWKTAPAGSYGVVRLDFEAGSLDGDDGKQYRSFQGSVDLYFRMLADRETLLPLIEDALTEVCGTCWSLNQMQHEHSTGYFHAEWVFEVEG